MRYGVMTLYRVSLLYYQKTANSAVNRVSLLYYQKTANSAVNRNLASVNNN